MTKDETLTLALETLVEMSPSGPIGSEIWHKQMNAIRVAGDALAQPEERNFCPRCGKRTADLTTVHTCTPPKDAR